MSRRLGNNELHLPDLSIKGFKCFDELSIPGLGRVNLFTGRNGAGKTAILEAVKIYAARADESVLTELIMGREELFSDADEDGNKVYSPDFKTFFNGRKPSFGARIEIGPEDADGKLRIVLDSTANKNLPLFRELVRAGFPEGEISVLTVDFQGKQNSVIYGLSDDDLKMKRRIRHLADREDRPAAVKSQWLGPEILSNRAIAELWDEVALTEDENLAVEAMNLVLDDPADRVAMIGEEKSRTPWRGMRRAAVRLRKNENGPVLLKSLGDGAVRLFSIALALANCPRGFLLIDEAENGIHHTVQRKFWSMILRTAQENDIQVFATTHSFDCVRGFAQAMGDSEDVSGVLVRIEREEGRSRCVRYSEEELEAAAEYSIEVR